MLTKVGNLWEEITNGTWLIQGFKPSGFSKHLTDLVPRKHSCLVPRKNSWSTHTVVWFPISDGKTTKVSLVVMRKALAILRLMPIENAILPILGLEKGGPDVKTLVHMLGSFLGDNFTLIDENPENLPWKGKERCMTCSYHVKEWSPSRRICDGCRTRKGRTPLASGGAVFRRGGVVGSD